MQRILIVGLSCSGKTTLARALSKKLNIQHKELDEFNWEAGWKMAEPEDFRERVDKFTSQDQWITDGNYGQLKDITWPRATHMLWIDLPLKVVLVNFFRRAITRSYHKTELWNGNRETLWHSIFSPTDSLLLWILKTHRRNRERYEDLIRSQSQNQGHPNLTVLRFKSHAEVDQFLHGIAPSK